MYEVVFEWAAWRGIDMSHPFRPVVPGYSRDKRTPCWLMLECTVVLWRR